MLKMGDTSNRCAVIDCAEVAGVIYEKSDIVGEGTLHYCFKTGDNLRIKTNAVEGLRLMNIYLEQPAGKLLINLDYKGAMIDGQ